MRANQAQTSHVAKEIIVVLKLAFGLFLLIALLSYHPLDPSFTQITSQSVALNKEGLIGSWLADMVYFICGYAALILPFVIVFSAIFSLYQTALDKHHYTKYTLWGIVLLLVDIAIASSLYLPNTHQFPAGPGGIIGHCLGWHMLKWLNPVGSCLIVLMTLCIALQLLIDFSWPRFFDALGDKVIRYFQCINSAAHGLKKPLFSRIKDLPLQTTTLSSEDSACMDQIVTTFKPPHQPKKNAIQHSNDETQVSSDAPLNTTLRSLDKIPSTLQHAHQFPSLQLLKSGHENKDHREDKSAMQKRAEYLVDQLNHFGISCQVADIVPGPVVTRYELTLAAGTKASKVSSLNRDIARALSVASVRVIEVIEGKDHIGIEIPNNKRAVVPLRGILSSQIFMKAQSPLTVALGQDVGGHTAIADIAKMPHLLIAGTTGAGKSVCLNTLLMSLLYKSTPQELQLILIDPKMLELSVYDGIDHLLTPVITNMKHASNALSWCVAEMERRYEIMSKLGVRNLDAYHEKIQSKRFKMQHPDVEHKIMSRIVIVIDEFADLMMVVGKPIEQLIVRIAQKARAAGIHLVLATQRPSVNVITGVIKANIPARIGFYVSSKIDSRTILDQSGAEQLLGHGDMLFLPPGASMPKRIHGAFVSDDEVNAVINRLKDLASLNPIKKPSIINFDQSQESKIISMTKHQQDPLMAQVIDFCKTLPRISISSIQRHFRIGYNRAANIVEDMEKTGLLIIDPKTGHRSLIDTQK